MNWPAAGGGGGGGGGNTIRSAAQCGGVAGGGGGTSLEGGQGCGPKGAAGPYLRGGREGEGGGGGGKETHGEAERDSRDSTLRSNPQQGFDRDSRDSNADGGGFDRFFPWRPMRTRGKGAFGEMNCLSVSLDLSLSLSLSRARPSTGKEQVMSEA